MSFGPNRRRAGARHRGLVGAGVVAAAFTLAPGAALAQDGTWVGGNLGDPDQWGEPNNWNPNTAVPTGTATFDTSPQTTVQAFFETTNAINFTAGSSTYAITLEDIFSLTGTGVTNHNIGATQTFTLDGSGGSPVLQFFNSSSASAGPGAVLYQNQSAQITFNNNATLGNATVTNGGDIEFNDSSNAGTGTINNNATVNFQSASTAAGSHINNAATGTVTFNSNSDAGTAVIGNAGTVQFTNSSSANAAQITNNAANAAVTFIDTSTAGNAIFNATADTTSITFSNNSTAGNATFLSATPGTATTTVTFNDSATAGTATFDPGPSGLTLAFNNNSSAASANFTLTNSFLSFNGSATAGNAIINDQTLGGINFNNSSSAASAQITTNGSGSVIFTDSSTAATAQITNGTNGVTAFEQAATAGNAVITNSGNLSFTGNTTLGIQATAANALITNNATGQLSFGPFDLTFPGGIPTFNPFIGVGSAGSATIVNNNGATIQFFNQSTAGTATITNNLGASLQFLNNGGSPIDPDGSTAHVINNLGGTVDISGVTTGVSIGTLEGAGGVFLGSKSLTLGNTNVSTTITGVIADGGLVPGIGGQLVKVGNGTLTLDGVNTYTGMTTVDGGVLMVGNVTNPGASIAGSATVDPGGTLAGHGTVLGSIFNTGGIVMPGGSIGVLHVAGAYTQSAAGTLAIEVSPATASQLKIGGAANLAGTLNLIFDPGVYSARSYTILTASNVTGTFGTVLGTNPSGLAQTILYDPTDVTLQLSAAPVVAPTNVTIYTDVASMLVMNAQQANGIILDRLGNRPAGISDGEVALGGIGAPGPQYAQLGNNMALGDLASALPQALTSQGVWFRGIGGFASVDRSGMLPSFNGSAGGFLTGFDRPVAENVYLGVAGGYLHSSLNETSVSSGSADTARFAVYGGTLLGSSLFTATAGYAHDWIDTTRSLILGAAVERHGADEGTAAAQWSLPLQVQGLDQGVATLTPRAGLQFLHLGEHRFSESGADGFDLSAAGHGTDSLQPFVALAVSQKFTTADGMLITPELRLGYNREALSGARTLTVATLSGAQFPVTGIKPSRDIATAGAGLAMQAAPTLALYATYDAVLPVGNTTEHTVQAGLRLKF